MAVGVISEAHISQAPELGALAHSRQGEGVALCEPAKLRPTIFSVDVEVRVQERVKITAALLPVLRCFKKVPPKPRPLFDLLRANEKEPLHGGVNGRSGRNVPRARSPLRAMALFRLPGED